MRSLRWAISGYLGQKGKCKIKSHSRRKVCMAVWAFGSSEKGAEVNELFHDNKIQEFQEYAWYFHHIPWSLSI